MFRKLLFSILVSGALCAGLCGCGSDTSGADFYRAIDGTGTGNTGFYGDYTYGANDKRENLRKNDKKNITDTIDNSDSAITGKRSPRTLDPITKSYFRDDKGNVMRKDATGSVVGSDNFNTSASQGFSLPDTPVNP